MESNRSEDNDTGISDGDDNSLAEIKNMGDFREIFTAKRECENTFYFLFIYNLNHRIIVYFLIYLIFVCIKL